MQNVIFLHGTTAQNAAFTGPAGTLSIDLELGRLWLHDGVTQGGHSPMDYSGLDAVQQRLDALGIADIPGLAAMLAALANADLVGAANGIVGLNADGEIPDEQLPQYVIDVVEVAGYDALPETGEISRFYIDTVDNKLYRWTGSAYIEITPIPGSTDDLAEGETNRYYTDARQRALLGADGDVAYDAETGVFSFTETVYTKEGLGVDQIPNFAVVTQPVMVEATANEGFVTPLRMNNLAEGMGILDTSDGWEIDEGEMGFVGDIEPLTAITTAYIGEVPQPNQLLFFGTTSENNALTLQAGELAVDTDKNKLRLHDGTTQGGFELSDIND